ncbi:conidial pigment biosynthesis oxidase Arb2/brown2 [Microthyrium microscopicum]|uniref:Conidial pigment biosynthesis oxidase Arb2/brown2 n=1 Tax=Microthyrium microscopicum TaxID=703497 RepID=A0A6A6UU58_9PEZI|nr:conidial pigment biosynthesis oxidase Arb2/brown2 [Microthyrium microscopicum]
MRLFLLLWQTMLAYSVASENVSFTVNLTWEDAAPDGVSRKMILVNGTSPGPTLFINQGDSVKFLVYNNLPTNTTIHFHGITQLRTPWSDGVPGISQKPILPGESFLYQWTADDYGTYWYHGHFLSDISDGLFGPIHIDPDPKQLLPYNIIDESETEVAAMTKAATHPQLVTISDWSHVTSEDIFRAELDTNLDLYCRNSILINGRGNVNCLPISTYMSLAAPATLQALIGQNITAQGCSPPGISLIEGDFKFNLSALPPELSYSCDATTVAPSIFHVRSADRWASFNFILSASVQTPMISIDDHEMWVYAADGSFVEPQRVDGMLIFSGQRYSALVRLKDNPAFDTYTMRFSNVGGNQIIFATALLSYNSNSTNLVVAPDSYALYDQAGNATNSSAVTLDPSTLVPYPAITPAQQADATHIFKAGRAGAAWRWTISASPHSVYSTGNASYPTTISTDNPLLFNPNGSTAMNSNLTIRSINGSWVDIIVLTDPGSQNPTQPPHSFHKHSNKLFIIGSGTGDFNYTSVAEGMQVQPESFNLVNPPYRDSFISSPASPDAPTWIAIRYQSMNPGAFLLHCHIQPHLAGGMAMVMLDGVDKWPTIPAEYGG